jgi:hypothetical protein
MITEISVYLPNIPGQFSRVLNSLASADVSIRGFSVDLAGAISLLRLLFTDTAEAERAENALNGATYQALSAELLLVSCPDEPGQLLKVTDILAENDINVEYGYVTLGRTAVGEVLLALKVESGKEAIARRSLKTEGIPDHDSIPH